MIFSISGFLNSTKEDCPPCCGTSTLRVSVSLFGPSTTTVYSPAGRATRSGVTSSSSNTDFPSSEATRFTVPQGSALICRYELTIADGACVLTAGTIALDRFSALDRCGTQAPTATSIAATAPASTQTQRTPP